MQYRFIHQFAVALCVSLLVACGGSSSSGNSSNTNIAEQLSKQTNLTATYAGRVEDLMRATSSTDAAIKIVDPTNVDAVLALADEIDANNELALEVFNTGNQLIDIEQLLSPNAHSNRSLKSPIYLSDDKTTANIPIPVVLGVCALGLTATSWGLSVNENIKTVQGNRKECADSYREFIDKIPADLSKAEENNLRTLGYQALEACYEAARSEFYWQYYKDTTLGFASVFGPGQLPAGQGRILFQSISGAADVTTIYVIGTEPEASNRTQNRDRTVAFIAQADENGSIVAPTGEWNLIAITPASVRFGTSQGQTVSVSDGQTTLLSATTQSTASSTADDIASCEGGSVNTSDLNVLAILNFDGELINNPTDEQINNADVQLSGDLRKPTISWNFNDAVVVDVIASSINNPGVANFVYGIQGIFVEDIPNTGIGHLEIINPPLQYGNYQLTQTEVLNGFSNPSPDLEPGITNIYTITVRTEDGGGASVTFSF